MEYTPARSARGAAEPSLQVLGQTPFNAEAPLGDLRGLLTPNPLFYVRNHFPVPQLDAAAWRLRLHGAFARPRELTYDALRALPTRSLLATLECAGNGRAALQPAAEGEQWQFGAASTAEWTGAPLALVLAEAGLTDQAHYLTITGADGGDVPAAGRAIRYQRGLSREQALRPDVLLAYAMNGEPLPPNHGFPVRLLVPGWYGMASVKWVVDIEAGAEPFRGFYQADRYVMTHPEAGDPAKTPLEAMRVRSLITSPAAGATLPRGVYQVRGLAWSGAAPITAVEVSVDGGRRWERATLTSPDVPYTWRRWEYRWEAAAPGPVELRCRAADAAGGSQPEAPEWNRLGYANNAVQAIEVTVVS
jgi:DMSO/TMAO reductase YedYZ molybdopterin-dependent catalytic subunit